MTPTTTLMPSAGESPALPPTLPQPWKRALMTVALLGLLTAVAGVFIAPQRGGASILLSVFYFLSLALAGLLFVAFQNITGATWCVVLRRVPEAMASTLPLAAVLSLAVLPLIPILYEWSHADHVAADPVLAGKTAWLNTPFFVVRTVACTGVWLLFGYLLVGGPLRREAQSRRATRPVGASGVFLALFAVSFSILCFDWLMSVEPHWFSTAYAVYNFSGLFLGGVAAMTVLVITLRRWGPLQHRVTDDHLHDLGKLLFAFSTFWAYIWFCQYMLIWYANIPEETSHFIARQRGAWGVLFLLNLVVNWIIPFLVLLPRRAKRTETVLLPVAVLLIVGRWLDLYLLIGPHLQGDEPHFGIWEILPVLGVLSAFLLIFFRSLKAIGVLPRNDPRLSESLQHHQ